MPKGAVRSAPELHSRSANGKGPAKWGGGIDRQAHANRSIGIVRQRSAEEAKGTAVAKKCKVCTGLVSQSMGIE